jgi:hypothetical protein
VTEQAAPWEQVDRAEVERRTRAREPLFVLVLVAVAVGWAGVADPSSGSQTPRSGSSWPATSWSSSRCSWRSGSLRDRGARARDGYRLVYALQEHVDPGSGLREKVDRQAGYMTRIVWFRWWLLLFPRGLLVGAPWDRPLIAVPSALVLVAGVVAWALYLRRPYGFARRWVADPPGPPREMPPPRRWERWISGWRLVWVFAVLLVTAIGVGVVLGLVDR